MTVKIKPGSAILRKCLNWQESVEVTGDTPIECLRALGEQFPAIQPFIFEKNDTVRFHIWLLVNGQRIFADDYVLPLKDGDELTVILAVGGG